MNITVKDSDTFCNKNILVLLKSLSLSSKMIKYLKYRDDGIIVNGQRATVRYILRPGDSISLAFEDTVSADCTPIDTELDIIFENNDLIVINKPPFMPTHTSHGHYNDTLANALAGYFKKKNYPFVFRPINRLDRNTSGLVLVAKNKHAAAFLSTEMKARKIHKSYIAILEGNLADPSETVETEMGTLGVINKSLHRTAASIIVREVCSDDLPDAESALTYYKILKRSDSFTVVEAYPQTGRTHQLRVHFASIGCPILGDDIYGNTSPYIDRHALHAASLSLNLPPDITDARDIDPESITLKTDIPDDMSSVIAKIFN